MSTESAVLTTAYGWALRQANCFLGPAIGRWFLAPQARAVDYCKYILDPRNILPRQSECMQLAGRICHILEGGDTAVAHVNALKTYFKRYHKMMLELWDEACMKVKGHLQHHVPECLQSFECNLSCFNNERRCRLIKQVCVFYVKMANPSSQILARILIDFEARAMASPFSANRIVSVPKPAPELMRPLSELGFGPPAHIFVAKRMHVGMSELSPSDLLQVRYPSGEQKYGLVLAFVDARWLEGPIRQAYFVVLHLLAADGELLAPTAVHELVQVSWISGIHWKCRVGNMYRLVVRPK